jgi:hypothetical protein
MHVALAVIAMIVAGCRLDPLVEDDPGVSVNLLPRGTQVRSVTSNAELSNQIRLNDGIDDDTLAEGMNVIPRGTGQAGKTVHYWSFGPATRAPAALYEFVRDPASGLPPIDHPPLADTIPGDGGYSPLHILFRVEVTADYDGELITTTAGLEDAIHLGLVKEPTSTKTFVASPIVLPGTRLQVGDTPSGAVDGQVVYARGYVVSMFRFGGTLGIQPTGGLLPTRQVSFLREAGKLTYDATYPVFQATTPIDPPDPVTMSNTYSALSVVINVDLKATVMLTDITRDDQLYVRDAEGEIMSLTGNVVRADITTSALLLPLQFEAGKP